MGNRMNHCCRTTMETEDETPPDFPDQLAPTIPEHLDREYRSKVNSEDAPFQRDFKPRVHFEQTRVTVAKVSTGTDVAIQARPSIAGFHHDSSLCANQDIATSLKVDTPVGFKIDVSVGEDGKDKSEKSYNGVLDNVLGSVLDRCYLFCYEREWRTWQSRGAVGRQGSRAFSVSQAQALANMELGEFEDLNLAMVIELDMVPGSIAFVGQDLSLAGPVSINAVRVVYWLQDFVLVCQANDGRVEAVAPDKLETGVGVGTQEEAPPTSTTTSERISFQEYSWLLDDFDDMLVRRKFVGQVPESGSLEAARLRRKEMESERQSSRLQVGHATSYSSRRSDRKPIEETNQTLRALREQPTFPQIAKPRRARASNSLSGGD